MRRSARASAAATPAMLLLLCLAISAGFGTPVYAERGEPVAFSIVAAQDANTPPNSLSKKKKDNDKPLSAAQVHNPVLWKQPEDIAALNLFYGQGGESHQPVPPFTFEAEARSGTNPKFDARDAKDHRWRVKLAEEARPEVVASRLLWAMGFYAHDDYLLHEATVSGLKLKRGKDLLHGEQVVDARFARKPGGQSKIGTWRWKENPFLGSREFNGLRVMMAVMNNWDLKDENNAVYHDDRGNQDIFLVNDVGATFATTHLTNSRAKDKGNVESFKESKFIAKTTEASVDFGTPAPPTGLLVGSFGFTAGEYFKRHGMDWIGKDIPRADARWIGSFLAQLSHEQLMDAFRAGNFSPEEINEYVAIVEDRIQQLKQL